MNRIFLTLAVLSTLLLVAAFALGMAVGDPHHIAESTRRALSRHLLTSVAALIFSALVHAVLLTYFMGTSRWLEETQRAYALDLRWNNANRALKYRAVPLMAFALVLLILNIPLGAMAVDARPGTWSGLLSNGRAHLVLAVLTVLVNAFVNVVEYRAIGRNGQILAEVVNEIRRIRQERGLPV